MVAQQVESTNEFLWNTHGYINEHIRFVDGKAELVIGWTSALMGLLLAGKFHHAFVLVSNVDTWMKVEGIAAIIGFSVVAVAFSFAFIAVIPRLTTTQAPGYIFWDNILAYKAQDKYVASVTKLSDDERTKQVAQHLFDLSRVCHNKLFWVNLSIYFAFVGSIICGITYFAFDLPKSNKQDLQQTSMEPTGMLSQPRLQSGQGVAVTKDWN